MKDLTLWKKWLGDGLEGDKKGRRREAKFGGKTMVGMKSEI